MTATRNFLLPNELNAYRQNVRDRRDRRVREEAEYESRLTANDLLKPGTPATMFSGSDRYPYEVVDHTVFASGQKQGKVKTVTVRALDARRTDSNGMSESQDYEYTSNPDNGTQVLKAFYNADGSLRGIGESTYRSGPCVRVVHTTRLGHARKYRDPSF